MTRSPPESTCRPWAALTLALALCITVGCAIKRVDSDEVRDSKGGDGDGDGMMSPPETMGGAPAM